ncbi:uncharacterized protein RCC_08016 [Ramularia collo-cygni]|uniref:Uncharacterized protein n=1 Tax=Ramularia collo-cygni TaxID=112498 RepID=A0A2D3VBG3_9PEZI|nr:uncharacterized protein RCC_08016 [Ramularia collo-cygni]CZT22147.1 uncharacterized protein RCC_08016 [Ramularia collo-cygni]
MSVTSLQVLSSSMVAELTRIGHTYHHIPPTLVNPPTIEHSRPPQIQVALDLAIGTMNRLESGSDSVGWTGTQHARDWLVTARNLSTDLWPMDTLVKIFSDVFFLDDPRYPVTFNWDDTIEEENEIVTGSSLHVGTGIPGQDQIWIRVDPIEHHQEQGLPNFHVGYLSTFANQSIHSYLSSCCCAGANEHANFSNTNVCRRIGNQDCPEKFFVEHTIAWFFLASRIELYMPSFFGFEANFNTFPTLVKQFRARGMRMSAGDWKLFFMHFTWEEVTFLLGRLDMEDYLAFVGFVVEDRFVMQVFADLGLSRDRSLRLG